MRTGRDEWRISYRRIVGKPMATGLLIGLAIAGALICPLMTLLARRGIGPGCILGRCADDEDGSAESLRRRQQELERRITELEADEVPADSPRLERSHDRQSLGHRRQLRRQPVGDARETDRPGAP